MNKRQFIRSNRTVIDEVIHMQNGIDDDYRLNDAEREQWLLNNPHLYFWARSEGVNI